MNPKKSTFSSPTLGLVMMSALLAGSGPRIAGMPPRGINFDTPGDDGGDPPPAGGEQPPAGGDGGKKKVEFTPEQQEFLERLNNEAFAKGFNKAEKQNKADKEAFQKQLDDLKKLIPAEPPAGEVKKAYGQEEVETLINEAKKPLLDRLTDTEKRAQAILEKEKMTALRSAALKAKAADEGDVATLLERFVTHDNDGNLVVLNKEGHPALDGSGKPQTVEGFVKAFVESKPHLQASSGRSGAGSGSHNQGGSGKPKPIKSMADAKSAFAAGMAGQTIQ